MTQRSLAAIKAGVVLIVGLVGALAVPRPAVTCGFLSFGNEFNYQTFQPVPCGPATFSRVVLLGGAALIAITMRQRELSRRLAEGEQSKKVVERAPSKGHCRICGPAATVEGPCRICGAETWSAHDVVLHAVWHASN